MVEEIRSVEKHDREKDPVVIARRNELYKKYIEPNYTFIRWVVSRYSFSNRDMDENYNDVLINFYRFVETYNENMNLLTWLHICAKRHIFANETKRREHEQKFSLMGDFDIADSDLQTPFCKTSAYVDESNYTENIDDKTLDAIKSLGEAKMRSLILHESGYSMNEIAEKEHESGFLESSSVDTIKSRLFVSRKKMSNIFGNK